MAGEGDNTCKRVHFVACPGCGERGDAQHLASCARWVNLEPQFRSARQAGGYAVLLALEKMWMRRREIDWPALTELVGRL